MSTIYLSSRKTTKQDESYIKASTRRKNQRRTYIKLQVIKQLLSSIQVHLKKATFRTSRSTEGKPSSLQGESKSTTSQNLSSKYISPFGYTSISFCKESKKLVGTNNFLAWKKRIDLLLNENELLENIKGNITILVKEKTQALAKCNKDKTRAQRILIESIKDSLIPYVSKLETSKGIYDKLIELFSVSTIGEVISLRN